MFQYATGKGPSTSAPLAIEEVNDSQSDDLGHEIFEEQLEDYTEPELVQSPVHESMNIIQETEKH